MLFSTIDSLVFCSDIPGLTTELGVTYNAAEWRIFTDAYVRSLKVVLLRNGKRYYASVPVGHSVKLKDTYETLSNVQAS